MSCVGFGIENCGFCWHVAVHHAELFRVGRPCNVMDWTVFFCGESVSIVRQLQQNTVPRSILESKPPLALRRYKVVSP